MSKLSENDEPISFARKMARFSLIFRKTEPIQSLSGFNKRTHRIPETVNHQSESFVANLVASPIREELDEVFGRLRNQFGLKRKELTSSECGDGFGTINTPFFQYAYSAYLNPQTPSELIWQNEISEITEPNQLLTKNFETVFGTLFNSIEFVPPWSLDLTAMIDFVEDNPDRKIKIDYDRQISFCEIKVRGCSASVRAEHDSFQIQSSRPVRPRELFKSYQKVYHSLADFFSQSSQ